MEKPIKPSPSDFSLNEMEISNIQDPSKIAEKIGFIAGGIAFISCLLYFDNVSTGIFPGLLLSMLAMGLTVKYSSSRIEKHLLSTNYKYRKYREYIHAKFRYDEEIAAYEHEVIRNAEKFWRSLSGLQFEDEIANLYRKQGYDAQKTRITGDGGVDIILNKDNKRIIVQCKAHNKKISIGVARELVASMQDFNADEGIIACLEGATKPVLDYIKNKNIVVISLSEIMQMRKPSNPLVDVDLAPINHIKFDLKSKNENSTQSTLLKARPNIRHWSEKIRDSDY